MAKDKTSVKPRGKPLRGAIDGIPFTKDNQPTPAQKSAGWQEKRAERHLTQEIMKQMFGKDEFTGEVKLKGYVEAIFRLAMIGNPKAIETINNGIEEDIKKTELTIQDNKKLFIKINDNEDD